MTERGVNGSRREYTRKTLSVSIGHTYKRILNMDVAQIYFFAMSWGLKTIVELIPPVGVVQIVPASARRDIKAWMIAIKVA